MASRATIPILVGMMLLTGCSNTLLTKYQDMQCVADCESGRPKTFEQPVIQTLQMFVGESGCWLVVLASYIIQRTRKGRGQTQTEDVAYSQVPEAEDEYDEDEATADLSSSQTLVDPTNVVAKPLIDGEEARKERLPLTGWKVMMLALPAICDILGTTLMNAGLLFTAASIYQMTRGALVLFVGLFSVIFLKRHLGAWKWASLFVVVLGVAIVGLAGALEKKDGTPSLPGDTRPDDEGKDLLVSAMHIARDAVSALEAHTAAETILGVVMIAGAQIFTATQFVLEESIMEKYSMDPIQVVGWEGFFGFLVTLIGMGVLHAAIGQTAAGQGGYFDAREGFYEVFHNRAIAVSSVLIMISIG
jgi:drug/metabolite transporter (DMT)-like permease